ncbi:MAG TPA: YraN family protein [Phycisphaerales bacterium]|nr:YraN family protein [Phycisphaerales bacterium]HRQ75191.1 YraN family protein [Phycisphaerales bacterium]
MNWLLGWFNWLLRIGNNDGTIGVRGERLAADWLTTRGYTILHRNLVIGRDEIDLLALAPDRQTIVLVEVKTRSGRHVSPETAVNRSKQFRIMRAASKLQRFQQYRNAPLRLDVIAIIWQGQQEPELKHYEGAFESSF